VTRPTDAGSFAEKLYDHLEPLTEDDASNGWALLILCGAIGQMFQEVEDLARDSDLGPGWSPITDLSRVPTKGLGWLAQLVGVRMLPQLTGETDLDYAARMRLRISETDGFKRGTIAALSGAARQFLTGTKYVIINEREGNNAYRLGVLTKADETPDQQLVLNALLDQKPAGITLDYAVITGNTYLAIKVAFDTYAEVITRYPTYTQMRNEAP